VLAVVSAVPMSLFLRAVDAPDVRVTRGSRRG